MMREIAELHIRALPHTFSSRRGVKFVERLYSFVSKVGFVYTVKSDKKIIGAISGFGRVILTLVVDPAWQRKGIGTKLMQKVAGNILVYTEACSIGFYQKLGFKRIFTIGRTIFLWRS